MSRNEKIQKLANAIKDYRGMYHESTGKWFHPPKVNAITRVTAWLERLRLPVEATLQMIQGFKNIREYKEWISSL